jgi:hypothetical protein
VTTTIYFIHLDQKTVNTGSIQGMQEVYDDVADFIAASNPRAVIAFRPSAKAKARVTDLILREKTGGFIT